MPTEAELRKAARANAEVRFERGLASSAADSADTASRAGAGGDANECAGGATNGASRG